MKPNKKQFIEYFQTYAKDQGWPELLKHEHEFKTENWFGERMFIFQWIDGQIEYKDTYHFDGKDISLFKAEQRYEFGKPWFDVRSY